MEKEKAAQKAYEQYIPLPEPEGPYKLQTCSICHIRGHRASGNKDGSHCAKDQCTSWKICGRKDKHKADIATVEVMTALEYFKTKKPSTTS